MYSIVIIGTVYFADKSENYPFKEIQVWSANNSVDDRESRQKYYFYLWWISQYSSRFSFFNACFLLAVDKYLNEAKNLHGFNAEQALALLYYNKYNLRQSKNDLKRFAPLQHKWKEDKTKFIRALTNVGKQFNDIKVQFVSILIILLDELFTNAIKDFQNHTNISVLKQLSYSPNFVLFPLPNYTTTCSIPELYKFFPTVVPVLSLRTYLMPFPSYNFTFLHTSFFLVLIGLYPV